MDGESVLLVVGGGGLVLAGIVLLVRARLFRARAVRVTGRITKVDVTFREGSSTSREATVAFVTEDGREVTTKGGEIGTRREREGSKVKVLYDPRKPTVAYVEGTAMRGGGVGWLLLSCGLCVLAVAAAVSFV